LKQIQKQGQNQYQKAKEFQDLTISSKQNLDQLIFQKLAQNPALEADEKPDLPGDEWQEDPEGWNPEFAKPEEEWETGENSEVASDRDQEAPDMALALEKIAEEYCGDDSASLNTALKAIHKFRITGRLPGKTDKWLADAFDRIRRSLEEPRSPSSQPTFEAKRVKGRVTVIVKVHNLDFIRINQDKLVPGFSHASRFIEQRRNRLLLLNGISHHILENIQGDFFRQRDLKSALLALVPLPPKRIQDLGILSPVILSKEYLSRLGGLSVSCTLGVFPLSLFWQEKAALLRIWVQAAMSNEQKGNQLIQIWIRQKLQERQNLWFPSDIRHSLIAPLLNMTKNDIENAIKILKKSS
jgi:hypothetical protein